MLDFQNHQTIAGFFAWDMPFLRHDDSTPGKILGGWSLTANGYGASPTGRSVCADYDANAQREATTSPTSRRRQLPEDGDHRPGDLLYQWIDPSAFTYPNGTLNRTFSPPPRSTAPT